MNKTVGIIRGGEERGGEGRGGEGRGGEGRGGEGRGGEGRGGEGDAGWQRGRNLWTALNCKSLVGCKGQSRLTNQIMQRSNKPVSLLSSLLFKVSLRCMGQKRD